MLKYRLARAKDRTTRGGRGRTGRYHPRDAAGTQPGPRIRHRSGPCRVIGFSAGAYLAALIETRFDAGNDSSPDPIERVSSRPDFDIIVYPGYREGSITVPKNAPPAFLTCADDDPSHVVTTAQLYLDLQKQGISSEMHIYASGGHGFGIKHRLCRWPPGRTG